jgi:hypothetical protein
MSLLLYPRLTPLTAQAQLNLNRGKDIDDLARAADVYHPDMQYAPTGGEPASAEHLRLIADTVRGIAKNYGYPYPSANNARIACDRAMAATLFREMRLLPVEAAAKDIWTFFSVVVVPDVVEWRWQAAPNPEQRWICSDITRHSIGRLWWQAFTLGTRTDDGIDLTLLEMLTESDLNQIFEKRSIGGRPALARAIARAIADPAVVPPTMPRRPVIRDVTKRIRRLLPFTLFLALDEPTLALRIDDLVRDSLNALRNTATTEEVDESSP